MLMVLHCAGWPEWLNFRTLVGSISQRCEQPEFLAVQQVWPQPQVVSCQIGQPDMYVRVSPGFLTNDPKVDPSYEFGLPGIGACGIYYYDRPNRD